MLDMAFNYIIWKYESDVEQIFNGFIQFFDQINRNFPIPFLLKKCLLLCGSNLQKITP